MVFDTTGDYFLPPKEVIREAQAMLLDQPDVDTSAGLTRREQDGACRVMVEGEPITWILK